MNGTYLIKAIVLRKDLSIGMGIQLSNLLLNQ